MDTLLRRICASLHKQDGSVASKRVDLDLHDTVHIAFSCRYTYLDPISDAADESQSTISLLTNVCVLFSMVSMPCVSPNFCSLQSWYSVSCG